jgi:chromate reductase
MKNTILAFSGSSRKGSWNSRLLKVVCQHAESAGAGVTTVDLRDLRLPIYDGDIEAESGIPRQAIEFRKLIHGHRSTLIACPEYNGSVSPLLKNTLDWCSRPVDGQDGLAPFRGKHIAVVSASLGPFGGLRALGHLRGILSKMGAIVLADELSIPSAHQAFSDSGALVHEGMGGLAAQVGVGLARFAIEHRT